MKQAGYILLGIFGTMLLIAAFNLLSAPSRTIPRPSIGYSEFLAMIGDGAIVQATFQGKRVFASRKDGPVFEVLVLPPEKLAERLVEKQVRVSVAAEPDQDNGVAAGATVWVIYLSFHALIVWFFMGRPLYRISATLARHEAANKGGAQG